jgi:hypothetical protein
MPRISDRRPIQVFDSFNPLTLRASSPTFELFGKTNETSNAASGTLIADPSHDHHIDHWFARTNIRDLRSFDDFAFMCIVSLIVEHPRRERLKQREIVSTTPLSDLLQKRSGDTSEWGMCAVARTARGERAFVEVMFNGGEAFAALNDELSARAPRPFPLVRIHLEGGAYPQQEAE